VLDAAEAEYLEDHPEAAPEEFPRMRATSYRYRPQPLTVAPRRTVLAHYGYGRKEPSS
jgi:hypothetical protein